MTDLDTLAARVHRLEQMERARGLLHEYAATVDRREVEPVVALFHRDAVLRNPRGTFTGGTEIAEAFRAAWEIEPSLKQHFVATPKLTAESDDTIAAAARFLFVGRARERSVIGWGTYDLRVDAAGSHALFRSMKITVELSTDLDAGWALDPTPV
ncbi:nuclear transport factor 2 family protein [Phytohabitans kaempferiae]|uniref:Nuclear transport factor 2 family protein n=1 Tax=Phytohabitans kaempferiae TaxID=1620943 RepID=A0ABV6M8Y8_9ACTN